MELEVDPLTPPRIKYQVVGNFCDKLERLWGKILKRQERQKTTGSLGTYLNSCFLSWSKENCLAWDSSLWGIIGAVARNYVQTEELRIHDKRIGRLKIVVPILVPYLL